MCIYVYRVIKFVCPFMIHDLYSGKLDVHSWSLNLSKFSAAIAEVSVPTTLSAGEFAPYAGCTDPATKVKETYVSQLQRIRSNRG